MRKKTRSLLYRPFVHASALLACSTTPVWSEPLSSIGRLQRNSSQCSLKIPGEPPQDCRVVQVDQKAESVIRFRFIGTSQTKPVITSLSFVSAKPNNPPPLRCNEGRCQLKTTSTWVSPVVSAAESFTDTLGLSTGIPKAWPARGQCQISKTLTACEATRSDGQTVKAEARF